MKLYRSRHILIYALCLLTIAGSTFAQSTNQSFPTPVTANEINGVIKARDVGDARLTSYYYQFDADQGDLFINIVTRNLTGDVDVFTQTGLRPLTKIVLYGDLSESETGRVLYFRKPEKLILRVQGRTPGDDPATFRIKFAGSFVASTQVESTGEPELPTLTAKNESGIRVNSVGTIVEVIPKATPTPVAVETPAIVDERAEVEDTEKSKAEVAAETKTEEKSAEPTVETPETKIGVVVTENIPESTVTKAPPVSTRRTARGRRTPPRRTPPAAGATTTEGRVVTPADVPTIANRRRRSTRTTTPAKTPPPKQPDPLENVNLVIEFKDGNVIQRPMSEVLRFTVDKGILTVIAKDGAITRHSILDVAKVTIQ